MNSNKKGPGVGTSQEYLHEWLWGCCFCGEHASMSTGSTPSCPNCGRFRCVNCPLEEVKISRRREHIPRSIVSSSLSRPEVASHTAVALDTNGSIALVEEFEAQVTNISKRGSQSVPDPSELEEQDGQVAPVSESCLAVTSSSGIGYQVAAKPSQKRKRVWKRSRQDSSIATRIFACPFNKLDPLTYDPRVCKKYSICLIPSVPVLELRRMKEHLLKAHGPIYCAKCAQTFEREPELLKHMKALEPCVDSMKPLLSLEAGISSSQWQEIVKLLKEKGGLKGAEKEKDEIDKWEKMWAILHPDVPQPSSPWVEPPSKSLVAYEDVESVVAIFTRNTTRKIRQGILFMDHTTIRKCGDTIRESFRAHLKRNPLNDDLDKESLSGLDWAEDKMFDQLGSKFPKNDFRKPEEPQLHYTGLTGPVLIELQSEKHNQHSHTSQAITEVDPLPSTKASFTSGISADSGPQDAPLWLLDSIDPNITLLSPACDGNHQPNLRSSSSQLTRDCRDSDPYQYTWGNDLSVSPIGTTSTKQIPTLYLGSNNSSYNLPLDGGCDLGDFNLSPEDHQVAAAELNDLLEIEGIPHVDYQDEG
ncbi:hypothetical protein BKA65DRAFT_103135 [Rhexocercosporidium sp. MPI-PUGE-AT-0058]|nr:hypothetical protein BKA65DRAFT_103135 [Rhexocercosporidium sp. MPI-PUGE-AT-0058]